MMWRELWSEAGWWLPAAGSVVGLVIVAVGSWFIWREKKKR